MDLGQAPVLPLSATPTQQHQTEEGFDLDQLSTALERTSLLFLENDMEDGSTQQEMR